MINKNDQVVTEWMHPWMRKDLERLDRLHMQQMGYPLTVTSGMDGKHTASRSDHYNGTAVDIRTWTSSQSYAQLDKPTRDKWILMVRGSLGSDWVVYDEDDHFHLSWKPIYSDERYG